MKRWLADLTVVYHEVDIEVVPEARRILRDLTGGYLSVPTLVFDDGAVLIEPRREQLLAALHERAG